MNTFRTIIDICLLRGKPQDLPTSFNLVLLAAGAGIVIDALSLSGNGLDMQQLLFAALQTVLFGAGLWLLLKQRGFVSRWIQTATALYAVNALFSLVILPLLPALYDMARADPPTTMGWQQLAAVVLSGWFLAVMAQVLREALEVSLGAAVVISLALMIALFMVGTLLAAMLGLYAPT